MASNDVSTRGTPQKPASATKRRPSIISGLVVRVLIALVLSWLIVMFFVTVVVSH